MLVELKLNIGTADAGRLGLDKTREGDQVDVPEKVAAEMIGKGWASEVGASAPRKIQAVPPVEVKAEASPLPGKPLPGK